MLVEGFRLARNISAFTDHSQNYWQLASIQAASIGLPVLVSGGRLAEHLSMGAAISSIIIGNLLLWAIGLVMISLAITDRSNAIEMVKKYLGKTGALLSSIFLVIAFLSWYVLQIKSSIVAINQLVPLEEDALRWGAVLGLFVALLSIGGIYFIKKLSVISLPFLFLTMIYLCWRSVGYFRIDFSWEFSFTGTIAVLSLNFGGMVNLPTFFRHSRSRIDSYFGLSLTIFLYILFQLISVMVDFPQLSHIHSESLFHLFVWLLFILVALCVVNLVNIYFASAGWEMIFPHRKSSREYVVVGLLGTTAYTFLQLSQPMQYLENMASNFIASLGLVLVLAFVMRLVLKNRPNGAGQYVNIGCWIFGGILGTAVYSHGEFAGAHGMILSMTASLIAYLCVIFVEETVWAVRKLSG